MQRLPIVLGLALAALACGGTSAGARAVFVLIDAGSESARLPSPQRVSEELLRLLPASEPIGFARIDRGGFAEHDLLARVGSEPGLGAASEERRAFHRDLERLLREPGAGQGQLYAGLTHAARWLREAGVRSKVLVVLADLERNAAQLQGAGDLDLEGIDVVAWRSPIPGSLTGAGAPRRPPSESEALRAWRQQVEAAGGNLHLFDGVAGLASYLES